MDSTGGTHHTSDDAAAIGRARIAPLVAQFEWGAGRLLERLAGPTSDSGDGSPVEVPPMGDDEYFWEPVEGCWSVRSRSEGPGPGAVKLVGAGEWGRDGSPEAPWPPPVTTIAWRLDHVNEMLLGRADHLAGSHSFDRAEYRPAGDAATAVARLREGVQAWRQAIESVDPRDHASTGLSTYPYGSDPDETFVDNLWWLNQEIIHHGAEIALLRDLYSRLGSGRSRASDLS